MSAWRGSLAIVSLRYLFFGLPDPELSSYMSRSSTPILGAQDSAPSETYALSDEVLHSINETMATYQGDDRAEGYDTEHLSPESYPLDPFSRTPSPLPSPRPAGDTITFDHWLRRYDIHNMATSELFNNLSTLATYEDPALLRYVLLPLMVLALVSRPDSSERALCLVLFERFQTFADHHKAVPNPIGGSRLEFDIPWDRLDAYSAEMEQQRREDIVFLEPQLINCAPEWNWWLMLKRIDLKTVCK